MTTQIQGGQVAAPSEAACIDICRQNPGESSQSTYLSHGSLSLSLGDHHFGLPDLCRVSSGFEITFMGYRAAAMCYARPIVSHLQRPRVASLHLQSNAQRRPLGLHLLRLRRRFLLARPTTAMLPEIHDGRRLGAHQNWAVSDRRCSGDYSRLLFVA